MDDSNSRPRTTRSHQEPQMPPTRRSTATGRNNGLRLPLLPGKHRGGRSQQIAHQPRVTVNVTGQHPRATRRVDDDAQSGSWGGGWGGLDTAPAGWKRGRSEPPHGVTRTHTQPTGVQPPHLYTPRQCARSRSPCGAGTRRRSGGRQHTFTSQQQTPHKHVASRPPHAGAAVHTQKYVGPSSAWGGGGVAWPLVGPRLLGQRRCGTEGLTRPPPPLVQPSQSRLLVVVDLALTSQRWRG